MTDYSTGCTEHSPTQQDIDCDELVEFVCRFLALGFRKHALKKKIETELKLEKPMSWPTFMNLMSQARTMLKETLLSPEQHRINAIEMIYQVIQDIDTHPSTKLRAAEVLMTSAAMVSPEQNIDRVAQIRQILASIDSSVPVAEEGEEPDIGDPTPDPTLV